MTKDLHHMTKTSPQGPGAARCWAAPLVLLGIGTPAAAQVKHRALQAALTGLLEHSVPIQTVGALAQTTTPLFLLDAREWDEYRVSHLPGAIWVGYTDFSPDRIPTEALDQAIVVYCSVGYRSEKIGEQLRALGYSNVYNLYGGIFEWAHQEQALVNYAGQATRQVHAYDWRWGRLLRIRKKWKVYGGEAGTDTPCQVKKQRSIK